MRKWGFGIPGFKYHDRNGKHVKGKQYGYVMKPNQAIEGGCVLFAYNGRIK